MRPTAFTECDTVMLTIIMLYFIFLVLIYPIIRSLYLLTTQLKVAQLVKNLPAMQEIQETQVQFLGCEDPLGKETATHLSILAQEIPQTEESGVPRSMGSQRVGHN